MRLQFRWEYQYRPRWLASLQKRSLVLPNPIDLFRRRLTRGLEVRTSGGDVRRGDQVDALVTISNPRGLGNVEVGLVCTEYYDEETTSPMSSSTESDGFTTTTSRTTSTAIAHEAWIPIESVSGVQNVRLTIPPEAPFSYEGDCLSFKWEVVARGRRSRRLDAQARQEISVLP